jgi:hypothetical protein
MTVLFLSLCGIDDRRDLLQPGADHILEALDVVLPRRSNASMRTHAPRHHFTETMRTKLEWHRSGSPVMRPAAVFSLPFAQLSLIQFVCRGTQQDRNFLVWRPRQAHLRNAVDHQPNHPI